MNRFSKYLLRTLLVLFVLVNMITAFHAYKFTHFYDANEVSIKRKEDKSGLDITKEILFGINAVKRPVTPPADSSLQTIYFTTKDDIKIEAWHLQPRTATKGTVIMFHGHGGTKSSLTQEADAFNKMGYKTLMLDFRAHGNSGGNTCTIGYYETEEVKLAYDYIKQKGEKNIILWGISMGAATILKAMNDYPLQPAKIIAEMPFGSIEEAAGGRIKLMGIPAQPLATLITFWGGAEHGFWAFNMKPAEYAKKIQAPVLLQWGRNDARVTQKETDDIFNNLQGPKKLAIYEQSGHQSLCKNENAKWLSEVQSFLSH
jgi:uncharacterized protein